MLISYFVGPIINNTNRLRLTNMEELKSKFGPQGKNQK